MLIFMSAPGIVGDVVSAGRVGQSEVLSCNFGFGRLEDPATDWPTGVVLPRLVSVVKPVDSASPPLALMCAGGRGPADPLRIQFATFDGVGDRTHITVDLFKTKVEQFATFFNVSSGAPVENLSFSYGQMSVEIVTYAAGQVQVIERKKYTFVTPP